MFSWQSGSIRGNGVEYGIFWQPLATAPALSLPRKPIRWRVCNHGHRMPQVVSRGVNTLPGCFAWRGGYVAFPFLD